MSFVSGFVFKRGQEPNLLNFEVDLTLTDQGQSNGPA